MDLKSWEKIEKIFEEQKPIKAQPWAKDQTKGVVFTTVNNILQWTKVLQGKDHSKWHLVKLSN